MPVTPLTPTGLDVALAVLTAMITPALLISACGTFILSTSNRLARIIDRVRRLSDGMEALVRDRGRLELLDERRRMLQAQLATHSRRAHLLQRSLMLFYVAAGVFVASSVALGVEALTGVPPAWVPVTLALLGAVVLFASCATLIVEARLQVHGLSGEMTFLRELVEHHARKAVTEESPP
ncbi:MAG: DUF2721 domain-containing protein [Myxococcaceae bacterium]|nr:DUF2721 domain-containing protein [Myxococcaceae bacterium]